MAENTGHQPRLRALDLVATAAHELKSPLVFISGLSEMLAASQLGRLSKTQQAYLWRMNAASQRLLQLVENLLVVNKSQHGRLSLALEPVNLNSLISQVLEDLAPRLGKKGIGVVWSRDVLLPPVLAEPQLLYQVFFNLFDNTIKYSESDSGLSIKFRRNGSQLVVQVRDRGFAIKPADLAKIFQRFGNLNQSLSLQASSSGLGLFIVKSLVELMGGSITAKRMRPGTSFSIKLAIVHQLALFEPIERAPKAQPQKALKKS